MTAPAIHERLANTALYYFIALSIWGYFRFVRKQGLDASFWGAIVIGEILLFAQAAVGGYMWIIGIRPARTVHLLYGLVTLMALPAVYMYTRGEAQRGEMLMYATTALITVGLILRSMDTAVNPLLIGF